MKKAVILVLVLLIVAITPACDHDDISNDVGMDTHTNGGQEANEAQVTGGNAMNEWTNNDMTTQGTEENEEEFVYVTVDVFLAQVDEHEEALGITSSDFADIDVEGFIKFARISDSCIEEYYVTGKTFSLMYYLDAYSTMLQNRTIRDFASPEMRVVESTDEEYEQFRDMLLDSLGITPTRIYENYRSGTFTYAGEKYTNRIQINRTMYMDEFIDAGMYSLHKHGGIEFFEVYSGDVSYQHDIFLSKDGKFFLICGGTPLEKLHIVRTFCTIGE